jgi:hypothetical protein
MTIASTVLSTVWNHRERRLRGLLRLGAQQALFLLAVLAARALLEILSGTNSADRSALFHRLFFAATFACSVWAAGRFFDRRRFEDFGLRLDGAWWLDFGFGLVLGSCLVAAIFLIEWCLGWATVVATFRRADADAPLALGLAAAALLFVGVSLREELDSRGYMLRNLAEALNGGPLGPQGALVSAWLLSSLIFGLRHSWNPHATAVSTLFVVLGGLMLGLGCVLTGRLAIPVGFHIGWNFVQGSVFGFPVSGQPPSVAVVETVQAGPDLWTGGAFGPEGGLLGLGAWCVGAALICSWVRWRSGQLRLESTWAEFRGGIDQPCPRPETQSPPTALSL